MGRLVLILLLGSILIFGVISITVNRSTNDSTQDTVEYFSDVNARNISNSMVEMILSQLSDSSSWRVPTQLSKAFFGGVAYYSVIDTFFAGDSLIKISVTANYMNVNKNIATYVKFNKGFVPPVVRGAWTANSTLNKTISDMYIDGRDHDLKNNVIPNSGVYGVSTSVDFVNTEKGYIGGTKNGIDYPPSFPENPNSIEEYYDWGGTFPTSPDQILGYPEGTLKSIAVSGAEGSQYVTDPNVLSLPLRGVTYIEIPNNQEKKIELGNYSNNKGILVIHNPSGTTRIKETHAKYAFQGLVIGDYMFHFHLDILGAVLLLSPNLETSKNCSGNRDHWIKFSSASIKNATSIVAKSGGGGGGYASGYGFAQKRVQIQYWFE